MYSTSLNQRIGSLIEKDTLSLPKDTVVSDAVNAMKEKGVSSVLVTSGYSSSSQAIPSEAEQTSMTKPTLLPALIEGIVTERDILYRVIADKKDPMKITLGEIMSSPIISVDEQLSLKDAISLMRTKHIRRLLVTTSSKREDSGSSKNEQGISHKKEFNEVVPLGIVTLMAIAGNMPMENLDLAEVEIPSSTYNSPSISGDKQHVDPVSSPITIVCPYCESKFDNKKDLSKHIDRIHLGSGLLEGDVRQW
jgi:CBS domain-containing protein